MFSLVIWKNKLLYDVSTSDVRLPCTKNRDSEEDIFSKMFNRKDAVFLTLIYSREPILPVLTKPIFPSIQFNLTWLSGSLFTCSFIRIFIQRRKLFKHKAILLSSIFWQIQMVYTQQLLVHIIRPFLHKYLNLNKVNILYQAVN